MAEPVEHLLDRAFQGWNHPINYSEVNALLQEIGPVQILLEHIGQERRGTLKIENQGPEISSLRMQYYEVNRGMILTSGIFIRILEDEAMMSAWPVQYVSMLL